MRPRCLCSKVSDAMDSRGTRPVKFTRSILPAAALSWRAAI